MSEWIKRSDREPPKGTKILKVDMTACELEVWSGDSSASRLYFTHWMPLPAPPPRTVTIEISEELARTAFESSRGWPMSSSWRALGDACAKALEER